MVSRTWIRFGPHHIISLGNTRAFESSLYIKRITKEGVRANNFKTDVREKKQRYMYPSSLI